MLLEAFVQHRALVEESAEELLDGLRGELLGECAGVVLALGPEGSAVSTVTREQAARLLADRPFLARASLEASGVAGQAGRTGGTSRRSRSSSGPRVTCRSRRGMWWRPTDRVFSPTAPVHFQIAHEFDIPSDALELAVIAPSLVDKYAATALKGGVGILGVTEQELRSLKNGVLERVWHYQARIHVPKFARGYVTPEMAAWDEQSVYEMSKHRGRWTIVPNVRPQWRKYFAATGTYRVESLGDGRSRRVVEGDLDVRVRVVRQVAERLIVAEVRKAFEAEATTLRDMATLI